MQLLQSLSATPCDVEMIINILQPKQPIHFHIFQVIQKIYVFVLLNNIQAKTHVSCFQIDVYA